MEKPLAMLKITSVSYMTGGVFGCLRFTRADGNTSPKYGNSFNENKQLAILSQQLTSITVLKNNFFIVGLKFVYANGETADIRGTNA